MVLSCAENVFVSIIIIGGELDCKGRDNGLYVIRDLFSYLVCENHNSTVSACPNGQLFDINSYKCVPNNHLTPTKICYGTPNGTFRDPWNCNGFLKCLSKKPHVMTCYEPDEVYNPYANKCEKHKECVQCGMLFVCLTSYRLSLSIVLQVGYE